MQRTGFLVTLSSCTWMLTAGTLSAAALPRVAFSPLSGSDSNRCAASSAAMVEALEADRQVSLVPVTTTAVARASAGLPPTGPLSRPQAALLAQTFDVPYMASGELVDLGDRAMVNVSINVPARDLTRLTFAVIAPGEEDRAHAGRLAAAIAEAVVQLEAQNEVRGLISDADAARPIPEDWERPSVMIMLWDDEASALPGAGDVARKELERRLKQDAFRVIEDVARPAGERRMPSRDMALRRAKRRGAEVLLKGTAQILSGRQQDGWAHYEARLELHAIHTGSGETLTAHQGRGAAVMVDPREAGDLACVNAVTAVSNKMLYRIAELWNREKGRGTD